MSAPNTLTPPKLPDFLGLKSARRIVDVGCGPGGFTAYLLSEASPTAVAVGLDINLVPRTSRSSGDILLIQAAAERMPIRSDWADLAICPRLLMNVPEPSVALGEMVRIARRGGLVAALEPDFLAESGHSTVPGELAFLRRLLLLTSEGSDLAFGPKCVALFELAGLVDIGAYVHSPVTLGGDDSFPTAHRERKARRFEGLVAEWRTELASHLEQSDLEDLENEARELDRVRSEQLESGEYASASSFPLWVVRGRKAGQGDEVP